MLRRLCFATAMNPKRGNRSCSSLGEGAANSTNSKPSTPMGFSNCTGLMPTLGCALMTVSPLGLRPFPPVAGRLENQRVIITLGTEPPQATANQSLNHADFCADVDQLREERQAERLPQELHARRAAGALLVADDALHGLHMPKAPQLEILLHVHELLAHLVGVPPLSSALVDLLEHGSDTRMPLVGLGP